jgi:hypothetical protein
MKPVEDWRSGWKWLSVHCMTLAIAVQGAWMWLPPDLKSTLPQEIVSGISIGLLVLGVIGRFVKQEKKDGNDPDSAGQP